MSKPAGYVPDSVDLDYIEAIGAPIHAVLAAIEAAAEPLDVPILDRASGRVLSILAAGRRAIVEIGTAYGYSTLWLALGQPADGRIVTVDPDRARTDLARGWWREAGIGDDRITVVNRPALDAFAEGEPALQGPFDLAFIDALKVEYGDYLRAIAPRLVPGALVVADNVLWGGGTARPRRAGDSAAALRAFNAAVLGDAGFDATILQVGDGLLLAVWRGGPR
jgi:caffeoyl-CoA O-methyltransferase